MRSATIAAIVVALPCGITASVCTIAGTQLIATLCPTGEACGCCEVDETVCAGYVAAGNLITCDDGKFLDLAAKGSKAVGEKPADNCCTVKSTCADQTCSAGMEKLAEKEDSDPCVGAADTCACCGYKDTVCQGLFMADPTMCGSDKFFDASTAAEEGGADAVAAVATCCKDMATCADASCASGWKRNSEAEDTKCAGDASSCAVTCCELEDDICATDTTACDTGTFKDPAKSMDKKGDDLQASCCTAQALCVPPTPAPTPTPDSSSDGAASATNSTSDADSGSGSGSASTTAADGSASTASGAFHMQVPAKSLFAIVTSYIARLLI